MLHFDYCVLTNIITFLSNSVILFLNTVRFTLINNWWCLKEKIQLVKIWWLWWPVNCSTPFNPICKYRIKKMNLTLGAKFIIKNVYKTFNCQGSKTNTTIEETHQLPKKPVKGIVMKPIHNRKKKRCQYNERCRGIWKRCYSKKDIHLYQEQKISTIDCVTNTSRSLFIVIKYFILPRYWR